MMLQANCDSRDAVARVWSQFEETLRRVSLRMTDDEDERDDLLQAALMELWLADPTRFDVRDRGERRYLRRILVNTMWRVWKEERSFEHMHHPDAAELVEELLL